MEQADIRSRYMLAGLLIIAFALPFAVGYASEDVLYDYEWFLDLSRVVLNGLMQGGVYAMFAVGLTLIFGVMRIINVAHGEMVMIGAYLTYTCFTYLGWDPLLALFVTLPIAFCLGFLIQKLFLNAVVGGPELTPLLITFGLGLSMIHIIEAIFTTDFRTIPYAKGTIQITENLALGQPRVISFLMALFISISVFMFLKKHRFGKAIRATAQNADVAMVCGINIYHVYVVTSGLGAALAVAGGCLVSIQFGFNPETGIFYTIQAFAIIILGGRGHYIGALIGGLMLAVLEGLVSFLVPHGTDMVEIAAYGLMIFVLLIRPQGLLGAKEA
jgi:branched-chain amino acid transport system permease protein